ncbi:MAG: copper resistance protein CopD [Streptosporangiales bacterium]|nr:copper resistance protein CopD [Streptosporangiales bacterium]
MVTARHELVVTGVVTAVLTTLAATVWTRPAPVPGLTTAGPAVDYGLPVVRVLLDVAAVAVVGLSLLPKLLGFDKPEETEPVLRPARRLAVSAAWIWMASALTAVVLQTVEIHPDRPLSLDLVVDYVDRIGAGKGLLLSAACALVCVGLGRLAVRFGENVPAELRLVVALFGLLPLPVTGHAANWDWHDLSMVSMELHVMGAALWAGGLCAVVVPLAARPELLSAALPRFSRLATVALFLVGATGLFNGLVELALSPVTTLPGSLFSTGYGQLVVGKFVCVVALAALGASIRYRLLPRVIRREPAALAAWALAEVSVMGVAYGLAVVLTRAAVA